MIRNVFSRIALLFSLCLALAVPAKAQSTLSPGDLVFTSFNALPAVGGDTFSFVLLVPISGSTTIYFTDRGYSSSTLSYFNAGNTEGSIMWFNPFPIAAGTEIVIAQTGNPNSPYRSYIAATGATHGAVSRIDGHATYGISLSNITGDQIFAYQSTVLTGTTMMIAGIHFGSCAGTTNAGWDVGCGSGSGISQLPPSLQAGLSAVWVLGSAATLPSNAVVAGAFNCTGTPSMATNAIRTAVNNAANWGWNTGTTNNTLAIPSGCQFIGAPAPAITSHPSDSTVCTPATATFAVAASGTGLSYQWQVSTTGTSGTYSPVSGVNYSGGTTSVLTVSNTPGAFNGYAYRCLVTNSGGSASSGAAILTVISGIPVISQQPAGQVICPGGNATFSTGGSNGTLHYQWQVNAGNGFDNITNGGIYSGANNAALNLTGVTTGMNGYTYRALVSNECSSTYTAIATLRLGNTWTGTVNTDWNNAGNWSCATLPASTTDVFINTNAPNMPVLNVSGVCRDMNIDLGATVTMGASQNLQINGNLNNFGIFDGSSMGSAVNFASASAQNIGQGTYNILMVSNGSMKTLGGNITINGALSMPAGKIVTANYLITMGPAAVFSNGAGANNYIITNGMPGSGVRKMNIGAGGLAAYVFPIGASGTSYTPVQVTNAGTPDDFTARVSDGVYENYSNDVPAGVPVTSGVVNKTWYVSEGTPGGSNANIVVQWNQGDELAPFVRTAISFSHFISGQWWPMSLTSATDAASAGPYTVARSGITSFSPFAIGNTNTALPVFWKRFDGRYEDGQVNLHWTVAKESNLICYQVQRSVDGRSFLNIGTVKAGNSKDEVSYKLADETIEAGAVYYYRLLAVDAGHTELFSQVIRVRIPGTKTDVRLLKNPVGNELKLEVNALQSGELELTIADINGRALLNRFLPVANGSQVLTIPAGMLVSGQLYLVRVSMQHNNWTFRIIK